MFATKTKMTMTDTMEDVDDIFRKLNKQMAAASDPEEGLAPRIVQQKEDVVYIKNPCLDWKFNKVLKFKGDGVSAITISL